MGTNYYWVENECECCNRKELFHIGKRSYGWAFTFKGYNNLKSWNEYKEFLKNKKILDEYDDEVSFESFVLMIETYGSPNYFNKESGKSNLDHINYCKELYSYNKTFFDETIYWHDNLGY